MDPHACNCLYLPAKQGAVFNLMLVLLSFRFGLLKSQALSDSSKAEHLLAKCTGKLMVTL